MKLSIQIGDIIDLRSIGYKSKVYLSSNVDDDSIKKSTAKDIFFIAEAFKKVPEEFYLLEIGKPSLFDSNVLKKVEYSFNIKDGDIVSADVAPEKIVLIAKDSKKIIIDVYNGAISPNKWESIGKMIEYYNIPSLNN